MTQLRARNPRRNALSVGTPCASAARTRRPFGPPSQTLRLTRVAVLVAIAVATAPSAFAATYYADALDHGDGTDLNSFSWSVVTANANPGTNDTVLFNIAVPTYTVFGTTLPTLTTPLIVGSTNTSQPNNLIMQVNGTPPSPDILSPAPLTTSGKGLWIIDPSFDFAGVAGQNATGNGPGGAGFTSFVLSGNLTNEGIITGGNGAAGGQQAVPGSAGASGGAGGAGLTVQSGSIVTNQNGALIDGGYGGNGAQGGGVGIAVGGNGGDSGAGGVGLTGSGFTLINDGNVSGGISGTPGQGGTGNVSNGSVGNDAPGGAAIVGSGLTITNAGIIVGGFGGNSTRAAALDLTGGTNTLDLTGNWTMTGGIQLGSGASLAFTQNTAETVNNTVSGAGTLIQNGSGNLTLDGSNTYTGGTTVQQGTLIVGAPGALPGSGTVTVAAPASLDLAAGNETVGALAGGGTVLLGNATLTIAAGISPVTLAAAAMPRAFTSGTGGTSGTASVPVGATTGFSGVLQGTGGVVVAGGAQTLSGVNTYTGPTTVQAGATLALAGAGSIATSSSVTNDGTLDVSTANGNVTLSSFTQGSGGTLVMRVLPSADQQLHVNGTATLGGALALTGTKAQYADGLMPLLTAGGGISGNFASVYGTGSLTNAYALSLHNVNGVLELLLTRLAPRSGDTNAAIAALGGALHAPFALGSAALDIDLNTDCSAFDEHGVCLGAGGRYTVIDSSGPHEAAAKVFGGYSIDDHLRVGGWADQGVNTSLNPGLVKTDSTNPIIGAYGVWTQHPGSNGYAVRVAGGYGNRHLTLTRPVINGSEAGTGSSAFTVQGASAVVSYDNAIEDGWTVAPYAGLRYTKESLGAYTENQVLGQVDYPLSYGSLSETFTTALVGTSFRGPISEHVTASLSAGIEQDLSSSGGSATVSNPDIANLAPLVISSELQHLRPDLSAHASYAIDNREQIVFGIGYSQQPFDTHGVTYTAINYIASF